MSVAAVLTEVESGCDQCDHVHLAWTSAEVNSKPWLLCGEDRDQVLCEQLACWPVHTFLHKHEKHTLQLVVDAADVVVLVVENSTDVVAVAADVDYFYCCQL